MKSEKGNNDKLQHLDLSGKKVQNNKVARRYFPYDSEFIDESLLRELIGNDVVWGDKRGLDFMKTYNDYMGIHDPYGDKY